MSELMKKDNKTVGGVNLKTPEYIPNDVAELGELPEHVNVVIVQSGKVYEGYAERLINSVNRHLSVPHKFYLFTDALIPGDDQASWWAKISIFNKEILPPGKTLYLDLDVVITGSLDDIVRCKTPRPMTIIKNFSMNIAHCAYNSSVMLFDSDDSRVHRIFDTYRDDAEKIRKTLHGDQCYVWRVLKEDAAVFPDNLIKSYKYDCQKELPEDTRVVVFHGKPDPSEVKTKWVTENWK